MGTCGNGEQLTLLQSVLLSCKDEAQFLRDLKGDPFQSSHMHKPNREGCSSAGVKERDNAASAPLDGRPGAPAARKQHAWLWLAHSSTLSFALFCIPGLTDMYSQASSSHPVHSLASRPIRRPRDARETRRDPSRSLSTNFHNEHSSVAINGSIGETRGVLADGRYDMILQTTREKEGNGHRRLALNRRCPWAIGLLTTVCSFSGDARNPSTNATWWIKAV